MLARLLFALLSLCCVSVTALAQSSTIDAENAIRLRVADLWVAGEFLKLDALAEEYRRTKSTVPGGRWKLSVFYEALGRQARTIDNQQAEWDDLAMQVKQWKQIAPKSPTAHLQFAKALIARAWAERGEEFASQVNPTKMRFFETTIRATREYLERYKAVASVDPHWHELMLKTTTWSKEFSAEFDTQMKAALAAEPLYWDFYFAGAEHNMPRWGGSIERVERFADTSVKVLPISKRDSYYAAIYWFMFDYSGDFSADSWKVDCERWMRGLSDIVTAYPDPWNLNNAARFASSCDARIAALKFLELIGDRPLLVAWGSDRSGAKNFARFKAWATLGPYFLSPAEDRPARNLANARALIEQADLLLASPTSTQDQIAALVYSIRNFQVVLSTELPEYKKLGERAAALASRLRFPRSASSR